MAQLPYIYFGEYTEEEDINWRKMLEDEFDLDDDSFLSETDLDVIGMLGFDPLEEFGPEDGGKGRLTQEKDLDNLYGVPTLKEEVLKGSVSSGNHGHRGRPGQVGGSGGGGGFSDKAEEITAEQRMGQATSKDIDSQMRRNTSGISSGTAKLEEVDGNLKDNVGKIINNAKQELGNYTGYLAGDTVALGRDYVDHMREVLSNKALGGLSAKNVDLMVRDSIKRMVHQEVESNRQQFTDHGIRHIVGNIMRADKIMMSAKDGHPDPTERLMSAFIMVHHDVGYTTPLVRGGGLRGVMISRDHKLFSEKILSEQRSRWNQDKIFSPSQFDRILGIVKTHDTTTLDKNDVLGTSVRLSDNLALFSKEKLPGMFKYVSGGKAFLTKMGEAAKTKDTASFEKLRDGLYKSIEASTLSPALKRDLKSSVKEISYVTPKFTLGVLAGEVSGISKKSGKINIDIQYNVYDSFLQKHFDMGQRQTKKLLEDYGHTDFTKTTYDLGDFATIRVSGYRGKELGEKEGIIEKGEEHLSGQHDQRTHGRRGGFSECKTKADYEEFVKMRDKTPEHLQQYLSHYTAEELMASGTRLFLSGDKQTGVGVATDGDLQNLFSLNHHGSWGVREAIRQGATKLDCFEGKLPGFYSKFGFTEYKREKNWTPGGPDVVYMGLKTKRKTMKEDDKEKEKMKHYQDLDKYLKDHNMTYEQLEDDIIDMMGKDTDEKI